MPVELRRLCAGIRRLAETIRKDLTECAPDSAAKLVAIYMFAKGYKTFQSALLLYRRGLWQDAASLARTLIELDFQARWLDKDRERAAIRFLAGSERDRIKIFRSLLAAGDESTSIQASAMLEQLIPNASVEAKWRTWWAKESNIEALARDVDCSKVYELQYRPLCWFVHSSPISVRYYVAADENRQRLLIDCTTNSPSIEDSAVAQLFFSASIYAFMDVLAVVDNVHSLARQKTL